VKGVARKYRINPALLEGRWEQVKVIFKKAENKEIIIGGTDLITDLIPLFSPLHPDYIGVEYIDLYFPSVFNKALLLDDLKELIIDEEVVRQAAEEDIKKFIKANDPNVDEAELEIDERRKRLKVDERIIEPFVEVRVAGIRRNAQSMSKSSAISLARNTGFSLIQDGIKPIRSIEDEELISIPIVHSWNSPGVYAPTVIEGNDQHSRLSCRLTSLLEFRGNQQRKVGY